MFDLGCCESFKTKIFSTKFCPAADCWITLVVVFQRVIVNYGFGVGWISNWLNEIIHDSSRKGIMIYVHEWRHKIYEGRVNNFLLKLLRGHRKFDTWVWPTMPTDVVLKLNDDRVPRVHCTAGKLKIKQNLNSIHPIFNASIENGYELKNSRTINYIQVKC